MKKLMIALGLAGPLEVTCAIWAYGLDYFGLVAGLVLWLWASMPLALAGLLGTKVLREDGSRRILAAGMVLALAAATYLHVDALLAFEAGTEPMAGASVFTGLFMQYPLLLLALAVAAAKNRYSNSARKD